jgi:hypothetical protein
MDIGVRQGMAWTAMPNPKILGVEGSPDQNPHCQKPGL